MNGLNARGIAIAFLLPALISIGVYPAAAQETPDEKAGIEQLIAKLSDSEWEIREGAEQELVKIGKPAISLLIQAVVSSADEETRLRSGLALSKMEVELSDEEIALIESKIEECKEDKTRATLWKALEGMIGGFSEGLRFVVRLDKKSYEFNKDKKIVVSPRLVNRLKEDMCVCVGFNVSRLPKAHYRFEIEGADGKIQVSRMSSDFDLGEVRKEHFVWIKPQEQHFVLPSGWWDLSGKPIGYETGFIFRCLEQGDTSLVWEMKKPGQYKLFIVYRNDNDGSSLGLKAWTGEVRSNTVLFELK